MQFTAQLGLGVNPTEFKEAYLQVNVRKIHLYMAYVKVSASLTLICNYWYILRGLPPLLALASDTFQMIFQIGLSIIFIFSHKKVSTDLPSVTWGPPYLQAELGEI